MAINLSKGQKIDLRKETGAKLTSFCVGVNWGAIETKGFLGLSTNKQSVDLDLSCILIDETIICVIISIRRCTILISYSNLVCQKGNWFRWMVL